MTPPTPYSCPDLSFGDSVSLYKLRGRGYPSFHSNYGPDNPYPEYLFKENISPIRNEVYEAVRQSFFLLGLDAERYGCPDWNPFAGRIRPGDTVVIKPNMVLHYTADGVNDLETLITHGSIIRPILDYVFLALGTTGKVIVCDSPQGTADFQHMVQFLGLRRLQEFYATKGFLFDLIDLRQILFHRIFNNAIFFYHTPLEGDPRGYRTFQLNERSLLNDTALLFDRMTGASLNRSELYRHHNKNTHEYLISQTVLDANYFINLPKMKTHKKCGVTLNLKGLVGINGNKNYLPHFATYLGEPITFSQRMALRFRNFMNDIFLGQWGARNLALARLCLAVHLAYSTASGHISSLYKTFQPGTAAKRGFTGTVTNAGNWPGNDILWRMVLDLNRILQYGTSDGNLSNTRQRGFFSLIDGVVAGEGDGPLSPSRKEAGVIVAGEDPLLTDGVAATLMGFDLSKIRLMKEAISLIELPLSDHRSYDEVRVISNDPRFSSLETIRNHHLAFRTPAKWNETPLTGGGINKN